MPGAPLMLVGPSSCWSSLSRPPPSANLQVLRNRRPRRASALASRRRPEMAFAHSSSARFAITSRYHAAEAFGVRCSDPGSTCTIPKRWLNPAAHSKLSMSDHR